MSAHPQPIAAHFSSRVELTIHGGFLATAGALQCDPVAKVHIVTVKKLWRSASALAAAASPDCRGRSSSPRSDKRTRHQPSSLKKPMSAATAAIHSAVGEGGVSARAHHHDDNNNNISKNVNGGIAVTISAQMVASTKPKYFTARPNFEETLVFDVEDSGSLTSLAGKAPSLFPPMGNSSSHDRNSTNSNESVEDFIVVTVEDATSGSERFFGEAYCPFSPHCPSSVPPSAPVRVMLQPRNTQDPDDPLFQRDMAVLKDCKLDDFGFLTVTWRVKMIPHGGAMVKSHAAAEDAGGKASHPTDNASHAVVEGAEAPTFPIGLTLKAHWQPSVSLASASGAAAASFTTSVSFGDNGDGDRFIFSPASNGHSSGHDSIDALARLQPLFLTIRSASQLLNAITFHCGVQSIQSGSREVAVDLPLPPLSTKAALDRDIHWTAPVRTTNGDDLGLLFASIRLSRKPLEGNAPLCQEENCARINDPLHQEEATHQVKDWTVLMSAAGSNSNAATAVPALPNAPFSAYQSLLWESQEHILKASERAWKRSVVLDAQPTPEHVRHVFDVLMGRVQLDAGVARVAAAFFNRPATELTAMDLKEFMVAAAFNGRGLSVVEAARFCFVALRRDVEDAVAAEEVLYMFLHALIGKTVDMSEGEIKRWVSDVIGDAPAVTFTDFTAHILRNEAIWSAFGVPVVPDAAFSSAQRRHHYFHRDPLRFSGDEATASSMSAAVAAAAATANAPTSSSPHQQTTVSAPSPYSNERAAASAGDTRNAWRVFVIRVPRTQKAFSVTAHCTDTVGDVKAMVEESTGISASRQEWRLNGDTPIDNNTTTIGNTTLGLPSAMKGSKAGAGTGAMDEVWIAEAEEAVMLHFSLKGKSKKWTEKIPTATKVLKVRASVQRQTLIPLSRCVLKVVNASTGRAEAVLVDRHPISFYKLRNGDVVEVSQEQ